MLLIEISKLKSHEKNSYFFDDILGENWLQFLESVKTSGVIEPIIITQKYIIVSGHQRAKACRELNIKEVPCEIKIYEDEKQILKDLLETNLRQRGIGNTNPIKFARCISELENIYGIKRGNPQLRDNLVIKTQSNLADELGINKKQLQDYKKLLTLIPELQDLIEHNTLSPTVAYKVYAKLPKEEQLKLINELGKDKISEMTQKQAEQYIKEKQILEEEKVVFMGVQHLVELELKN